MKHNIDKYVLNNKVKVNDVILMEGKPIRVQGLGFAKGCAKGIHKVSISGTDLLTGKNYYFSTVNMQIPLLKSDYVNTLIKPTIVET
jgi:translation elongation factor P/translation initiation factor 5A